MTLAILQARTSSSRLPGKVLKPILCQPMLLRQIERVRRSTCIDDLIVATSLDSSDDELAGVMSSYNVAVYRGDLNDVLSRFAGAVDLYPAARNVVRLTGDCPLADWEVIDAVFKRYSEGGFDYMSNCAPPTWPDGLDVEVMSREALTAADREAKTPSDREHVTPFLRAHPERFRIGNLVADQDLSDLRWTVDEPEDFALVEVIFEALYPGKPDFRTPDILKLLREKPDLAANSHIGRNEGYRPDSVSD